MKELRIVLLSLLMVSGAAFMSGPPRVIVGLVFLLFLPGYAMLALLFPTRNDVMGHERLALSIGASIALTSLTGFLLNYTPWGIQLNSVLISQLLLIAAMASIAWYRRRRVGPQPSSEPALVQSRTEQRSWEVTLNILLGLVVVGALSTLGYLVARPNSVKPFTDFSIFGPKGNVSAYPDELALREPGEVTVRIVNREQQTTTYRVEMTIGGEIVGESGPVTLEHRQAWDQKLQFLPVRAGADQKLEIKLYKGERSEPYEGLHFWLNVTGDSQTPAGGSP